MAERIENSACANSRVLTRLKWLRPDGEARAEIRWFHKFKSGTRGFEMERCIRGRPQSSLDLRSQKNVRALPNFSRESFEGIFRVVHGPSNEVWTHRTRGSYFGLDVMLRRAEF